MGRGRSDHTRTIEDGPPSLSRRERIPPPRTPRAHSRPVREGRHDAAPAREFTARRYGLVAAATALQEHPDTVTRFLPPARPGTATVRRP